MHRTAIKSLGVLFSFSSKSLLIHSLCWLPSHPGSKVALAKQGLITPKEVSLCLPEEFDKIKGPSRQISPHISLARMECSHFLNDSQQDK